MIVKFKILKNLSTYNHNQNQTFDNYHTKEAVRSLPQPVSCPLPLAQRELKFRQSLLSLNLVQMALKRVLFFKFVSCTRVSGLIFSAAFTDDLFLMFVQY